MMRITVRKWKIREMRKRCDNAFFRNDLQFFMREKGGEVIFFHNFLQFVLMNYFKRCTIRRVYSF